MSVISSASITGLSFGKAAGNLLSHHWNSCDFWTLCANAEGNAWLMSVWIYLCSHYCPRFISAPLWPRLFHSTTVGFPVFRVSVKCIMSHTVSIPSSFSLNAESLLSALFPSPFLCPTLIWFHLLRKKELSKMEREEVEAKMGREKKNEPGQHGVKDGVKPLRAWGLVSSEGEMRYTPFIFNKYHVRCLLKEYFIYSLFADPVPVNASFKYTLYLMLCASLIIDRFYLQKLITTIILNMPVY